MSTERRSSRRRAHPNCWVPEVGKYVHRDCVEPSGQECIEGCGRPAGTKWGPLWCPPCDVARLDRVSAGFDRLVSSFTDGYQPLTDDPDDGRDAPLATGETDDE